ncbi:NAD(P)H-dependent oxidoreductase [Microbulbifer sp. OS29]|uniref:NAD(P)H-dependent oxidoreductase n=1 Tax=Microbulbifer okhotskensis TaxID=2926617 RepID=A0A9X2J6C9_9GAMM|nr:NAD(P)H-dependent oxidoreductase [Microbulbifer okhotskensis]MCO1333346.1 NAD(P)H-dependent oxidoreductase [Microbulbifer okhotskensis]
MKTLVVLAHSDLERSIANKSIIDDIKGEIDITVRDLYSLYPEFNIDVEVEQQALIQADLIIFQYPLHWYSIPGILKEWLDKVMIYGFAYGSTGNKLRGKSLLVSTTVGGESGSYQLGASNGDSMTTFLSPLKQSADFCGLVWQEPIVSFDMVFVPGVDGRQGEIQQRAKDHAVQLLSRIDNYSIADGRELSGGNEGV